MKTLLFGGTFDPPHLGHMSLLRNAVAAVQPDRVLVIPAATPPHKQASATSPALRMAMCECFRPLFPALEVSDIEIGRGGASYTLDTVRQLHRAAPGAVLYLTIGGDMLLHFTAWHRYRELLPLVTLVAQGRGEEDAPLRAAALALEQQGGRVLLAEGPVLPLSSTQIRDGLAAGQDLWRLLPPPADAIAQEHRLYVP